MTRRDLSVAKKEFTTQKLRQEWAEHEQENLLLAAGADDADRSVCDSTTTTAPSATKEASFVIGCEEGGEETRTDETKQKRRRRRRSLLRRKSTLSASATFPLLNNRQDSSSSCDSISENIMDTACADDTDPTDSSFFTMPNQTALSTPNLSPKSEALISSSKECATCRKLTDLHFFSDTDVAACSDHRRWTSQSRPTTPIQSDSEVEMSRTKNDDMVSSSASWKWGELPTATTCDGEQPEPLTEDVKQAQRRSMISNVFNFMKQSKNLQTSDAAMEVKGIYLSDLDVGGLDPEVEALYFPPISPIGRCLEPDDRESGNGTSLPHSPSSIESPKSCDSDYDDGKPSVCSMKIEMSLCGALQHYGKPSDKEFDAHIVQYSEVNRDQFVICIFVLNLPQFSAALLC